ncbi:MAG: lipopolysaccharide transport periplasmic protein LptA [Pseudomonadales bacterium]|nr:lipopolysaccharide transport periplasmic protein LptA [Pseudomonadales bacterium]
MSKLFSYLPFKKEDKSGDAISLWYSVRMTIALKSIFTLSLLIWAQLGLALSSDQDKPIRIQADAATVDDKKGITIYSGNVSIDQGSLLITADTVKVIMSKQEVLQIIASMLPQSKELAHYEQESDKKKGLVSADAKMITYFLQEERIHLAGNAKLNQTGDIFSGDLLHYDLKKGIVELKGGHKKRVNIVLKPK